MRSAARSHANPSTFSGLNRTQNASHRPTHENFNRTDSVTIKR
jgi:hypothetical protein